MQKTDQTEFRFEKVIKKKREKFCVKWKGYDKITYYMHICLIAGYIKMMSPYKMSFIPEPDSHIKHKMKAELDLSNYATKSELKQAAGVDTWGFAKTASLKSDVNKLDIDKLKTISTALSRLRKAGDNYFVKETLYDRLLRESVLLVLVNQSKKLIITQKLRRLSKKFLIMRKMSLLRNLIY